MDKEYVYIPVQLKVFKDDIYYNGIEPLKSAKQLSAFVVTLLGLYFTNDIIKEEVDKYRNTDTDLDKVKRQFENVVNNHRQILMATGVLGDYLNMAMQGQSTVTAPMSDGKDLDLGNLVKGIVQKEQGVLVDFEHKTMTVADVSKKEEIIEVKQEQVHVRVDEVNKKQDDFAGFNMQDFIKQLTPTLVSTINSIVDNKMQTINNSLIIPQKYDGPQLYRDDELARKMSNITKPVPNPDFGYKSNDIVVENNGNVDSTLKENNTVVEPERVSVVAEKQEVKKEVVIEETKKIEVETQNKVEEVKVEVKKKSSNFSRLAKSVNDI